MEPLLQACHSRPALLALLSEAAALHACGRCTLRLAGVRAAEAYASPALPRSAAAAVAAIRRQQLDGGATDNAAFDAAGDGSKRRRIEAGGEAAAPTADTGAGDSTAAGEGPGRTPVCPLCLGLLQLPELGGSASGSTSFHQPHGPCCTLQQARMVSTLNDPGRYAGIAWGTAAAAAGDEAASAAAGNAQAAAAAEGEADGGVPLAATVEQRVAGVPSLAAAAANIAGEFDLESFGLEVSLPASLAVRQQALAWRLRGRGTPEGDAAAEQLRSAVDVKEAVRLCYAAVLSAALGKPYASQSDLRIALMVSHPDAAAECGWLAPSGGGGGGRQRRGRGRQGKQQQQQQAELPALTDAVVQRLAAMLQAAFAASCPPDAAQLAAPPAAAAVQLQARRVPVHIGGRYLKLRRGIPQSPWSIDGTRKGEGSVQEAIEQVVLPSLQADSYTMVAAGREDIDVRMLGQGRPFILEIHNARRRVPPPAELAALEARVAQASAGGVAVRGLHAATAGQLAQLKEGEQEKQKSYVAVCWLPRALCEADVALLAGTQDLEVQQDTPIRVLHRRANLCRPKLVHGLRAEALAGQPPGYFVLRLRTQAGTYIKEFVHGDLGRTRPSLGDLLGCPAQIVSLDVAEIHMEFGPPAGQLPSSAQQGPETPAAAAQGSGQGGEGAQPGGAAAGAGG